MSQEKDCVMGRKGTEELCRKNGGCKDCGFNVEVAARRSWMIRHGMMQRRGKTVRLILPAPEDSEGEHEQLE